MSTTGATQPNVPAARVFTVFFLSGVAGLIYEVIWVREFGNIFGNTASTASPVVAVFMGGLGAGSALAGRWADRRYLTAPIDLLRAYARLELAIAVLAAMTALVLPALVRLSGPLSSYGVGEHGWHELTAASLGLR